MTDRTGSEASFNMPQVAGKLQEELAEFRSVAEYIEFLSGYYEQVPIHQVVSLLAVGSEPIDRITGQIDPEASVASSFLPGGVVGIRAVEVAFGTDAVLELHSGVTIKPPRLRGVPREERADALDRFAGSIQAAGEKGYELAPGMHDLVDQWGDLTGDFHTTGYFRRGFGFVMFAAERWHEKQILYKVGRMATTNVDVDLFNFFEQQFEQTEI